MAKELSIYSILQDKLKEEYADVKAKEGHKFSLFFVNAANALSQYGDQFQSTASELCALALLSWETEDREAYLAQYETPGRVYQLMGNPPEWPIIEAPLAIIELPEEA